jgi:hypothetical protein
VAIFSLAHQLRLWQNATLKPHKTPVWANSSRQVGDLHPQRIGHARKDRRRGNGVAALYSAESGLGQPYCGAQLGLGQWRAIAEPAEYRGHFRRLWHPANMSIANSMAYLRALTFMRSRHMMSYVLLEGP